MEVTIGFIFIFITLVLPGMIFRRFYYLSEFSKQVSTSEPLYKTITYGVIPSVFIQLLAILLLTRIGFDVDLTGVFDTYRALSIPATESGASIEESLRELSFDLNDFMIYAITSYVFSASLGMIAYALVRSFGLDKRFKILRFKNQWAYIFSGEVTRFGKFQRSKVLFDKEENNQNLKVLFSLADVLVQTCDDSTIMYSGYVVDYDLDSSSDHRIARLYLARASRYKKDSDASGNSKIVEKEIPGNYVIIPGERIVNLNIWYVESEQALSKQKERRFMFRVFVSLFISLTVLLLFFPMLFQFNFIDWDFYTQFHNEKWYTRLTLWMILNSSSGLAWIDLGKKEPGEGDGDAGLKKYLPTIAVISVLIILYCVLYTFT